MGLYEKVIVVQRVPVDRERAQELIVEARVNVPGEIDVYENSRRNRDYLSYVCSIPLPKHLEGAMGDKLLAYARSVIACVAKDKDITFGE